MKYKIADIVVELDTFGRTLAQAYKYLYHSDEKPQIFIDREYCDNLGRYIRNNDPEISDDLVEYTATCTKFYSEISLYGGIMLHSSAVVVDGKAYLFSANSGTGKSTHTRLWLEIFGDRAYILNDDKPALRLENGEWYAYGTPWSGKYDISVNARVPLAGIAILERGDENEIAQCDPIEVLDTLVNQILHSNKPDRIAKILENLDMLLSAVPVYRLKCNMNPEAAIVSYEAMSGEKFVPTTEM